MKKIIRLKDSKIERLTANCQLFRIVCFLLLTTYYLLLPIFLRAEPGATTANFLLIPVGGRPVALGGAYTSLCEDALALHYNPAGLGVSPHMLTVAHNEYFLDLRQEYLAYVQPFDIGTFGVSLNYFDLGAFERSVITNTANPDLPTSYSVGGTFGGSNLSFNVGFGRRIFDSPIFGGIALEYINQEIDQYDGSTAAVNLGLFYRGDDHNLPLSFGLSVLHLGGNLRTASQSDPLPLTVRLGGAWRVLPSRLLVTMDVEKNHRDDEWKLHGGIEGRVFDMVSLRTGYDATNAEVDNGWTVGMGVELYHCNFDYAYVPFDVLGISHRFSIGWEFGTTISKSQDEVGAGSKPARATTKPRYTKKSTGQEQIAEKIDSDQAIAQGIKCLVRRDYEQAVALLKNIKDRDDNVSLHKILGLSYYYLNDFERCQRHLQRVVELDPNDSTIRNILNSLKSLD